MKLIKENFSHGIVALKSNEFLVATRTLVPDDRMVPLYDVFGGPLWMGRMLCTDEEAKQLERLRERQLEEAGSALVGGAMSMISNVQRLMKRHLEPMLYYTDNAVLNPGNSTVIMRTGIRPLGLSVDMESLAAYPLPRRNTLSAMVLFRPRSYSGMSDLPGFVGNWLSPQRVMEVTGFQIGRKGLTGNGVKSLTFPRFRYTSVQKCTTSVA